MGRSRKKPQRCVGVGDNGVRCSAFAEEARGYCHRCYDIFRRHCKKNGSWPGVRGAKPLSPDPQPYEWVGDEDALAKLVEEQERKGNLKSNSEASQEIENV